AADYRLISRRVSQIFQNQIRERNLFLRGLINWVGFKQTYLTFNVEERLAGKSKYTLARSMSLAIDGIISVSKKPLQIVTCFGILIAIFGLIWAGITFTLYFFTKTTLPLGWSTIVIIISLFSGVQLIFLGIVGEYIGAIFDEVKGRPNYLVDYKLNFLEENYKRNFHE
ncbi:MAG: glycosyltransferase, partial [Spirochaetota bacterium]|nr:glycosyltransferase [Spirochaetota bacterium]